MNNPPAVPPKRTSKLTDKRPQSERRAHGVQPPDQVSSDLRECSVDVRVGVRDASGSVTSNPVARWSQRQGRGVRLRHFLFFGGSRSGGGGGPSLHLVTVAVTFGKADPEETPGPSCLLLLPLLSPCGRQGFVIISRSTAGGPA